MNDMTEAEFSLLRSLVRRLTGIHLHESKRTLLSNRLRKLVKEQSLESFMRYYQSVEREHPQIVAPFVDAVTTRTTEFFRCRSQLDFFTGHVLPELSEKLHQAPARTVTVWSAGCASGEEAYSLAMLVSETLDSGIASRVLIQGTDISNNAIVQARKARYPGRRVTAVGQPMLDRYFQPEADGSWTVSNALRDRVRFKVENLLEPGDFVHSAVDVLFCRNVLIYFDEAGKQSRLAALVRALRPGGYLFLGPSEMILTGQPELESAAPSIYRKT